MSRELLLKATTRKILYSPASHKFLYTSEKDSRETIPIEQKDSEPSTVIAWVSGAITSVGLELDQLIHEDGFTFVCFRKDGVRAAFSVGTSQTFLSLPIVIVGMDRKSVLSVTDQIRTALHPSE